jgi:hypothetical protein
VIKRTLLCVVLGVILIATASGETLADWDGFFWNTLDANTKVWLMEGIMLGMWSMRASYWSLNESYLDDGDREWWDLGNYISERGVSDWIYKLDEFYRDPIAKDVPIYRAIFTIAYNRMKAEKERKV